MFLLLTLTVSPANGTIQTSPQTEVNTMSAIQNANGEYLTKQNGWTPDLTSALIIGHPTYAESLITELGIDAKVVPAT